jgi:hypothetical protein
MKFESKYEPLTAKHFFDWCTWQTKHNAEQFVQESTKETRFRYLREFSTPKPQNTMKHTIEQKHIYEPMEGLKIEIEHNGDWCIYHQGEIVDFLEFNWSNPKGRAVLVAIAEVIQYHNENVINKQEAKP